MFDDWQTTLNDYLFFYPLSMSFFWTIGSLVAYFKDEYDSPHYSEPPELDEYPHVTLMIPCYNEENLVTRTIESCLQIKYPFFRVLAVNDGSKDKTGEVLDKLKLKHPHGFEVIHQENAGKAAGLLNATKNSPDDILICIDADTQIDPHCVHWIVKHFISDPTLGAVTGNPRIDNRENVVSRLQVGEYSTMFGMIKRSQNFRGAMFTISGVIAAYRKSALEDVNYWTHDALTEDIDITWKLQRKKWKVKFEPRALVWCSQPSSVPGLWNQRKRWAIGGAQVFVKNVQVLLDPSHFRLWPILYEMVFSYLWAYLSFVHGICTLFYFALEPSIEVSAGQIIRPLVLFTACLSQVTIGTWMDVIYDPKLFKNLPSMFWYPVWFWLIGWMAAISSFPLLLTLEKGRSATWDCDDRGEILSSEFNNSSGSVSDENRSILKGNPDYGASSTDEMSSSESNSLSGSRTDESQNLLAEKSDYISTDEMSSSGSNSLSGSRTDESQNLRAGKSGYASTDEMSSSECNSLSGSDSHENQSLLAEKGDYGSSSSTRSSIRSDSSSCDIENFYESETDESETSGSK